MQYRFDLHCHSWYSGDGVSSPEELIQGARAKGLNGFALTDHNTCDAVTYCLQEGLMRKDGQPVDGFLIIPGVEVTTDEGHLLCLGTTLPYMKGKPAAEVCRAIRERGGLAIPPHPYDAFRSGIREETLDQLDIDAIEVFNSATTMKRHNERALEYAKRRNLPMTAASDAHHHTAIGTAYITVETDDFTVDGVLRAMLKGAVRSESYLTGKDIIRKTWYNWLRLSKRRHPPKMSPQPEG